MSKLLIVDDSATSRAIFKACLGETDHEIKEAANHDQALLIAREFQPDLCILDYNLPDKNGVEIAQSLIEAGIDAKYILMTANMQDSVVERAKELDFTAFLEKPVTPEKVANVLKDFE